MDTTYTTSRQEITRNAVLGTTVCTLALNLALGITENELLQNQQTVLLVTSNMFAMSAVGYDLKEVKGLIGGAIGGVLSAPAIQAVGYYSRKVGEIGADCISTMSQYLN
jgi:hypothetical protein